MLNSPKIVTLYDQETTSEIAQVQISANITASEDSFAYVEVPPIALDGDTTYLIAAYGFNHIDFVGDTWIMYRDPEFATNTSVLSDTENSYLKFGGSFYE
jgi:hypothetical protein